MTDQPTKSTNVEIDKVKEALKRALKALDNWTPRFAFIDDAYKAITEALDFLVVAQPRPAEPGLETTAEERAAWMQGGQATRHLSIDARRRLLRDFDRLLACLRPGGREEVERDLLAIEEFLGDAEHFELADDSTVDIHPASDALDRLRMHIRTLSRSPGEEAGWQAIDSALKTNRAILVWCPEHRNTYEVSWDDLEGAWSYFGGGRSRFLIEEPTMWRPLPDPPVLSQEEGKP